ncbi:M48 family metalloprotease [Corallococcus llansteffanensis]|uniref:Peptidase M48 domain-containing protein n=1 Tax=Corallococcus llansteffanensis TaxID=2316731 RepID=A0A3A8QHH9_9BACT|nr:M48 family metalloprotease [Corallococcus llansteffanensis]RKH66380.1 hypothetical protein D7V93_04535 [Corallococcus llansteffanensis]
MASTPFPGVSPRLEAFAFPSNTSLRFVLLLVSVLGASTFFFRTLPVGAVPDEACMQTSFQSAEAQIQGAMARLKTADPPVEMTSPVEAACMRPYVKALALRISVGMALLLVVSTVLFWLLPAWTLRRKGLVPLKGNQFPELRGHLDGLCREAGLLRQPRFMLAPFNPSPSGHVFGRTRRHWVALSGGLVKQFQSDRSLFDAVLRHELAHLRNADVGKAFFSVALWWGFLLVALLPYVLQGLTQAMKFAWPWTLHTAWRMVVLTGLVVLVRNSVLRVRELYADLRASELQGPEGALERVVAALPRPKGGRWRELLRNHPPPESRVRVLTGEQLLSRPAWGEAFAVGLLAMVAFADMDQFLMWLLAGTPLRNFTREGAALAFIPLAIGITGLGLWRTAFSASRRGESLRGVGPKLALCLGVGLVLGEFLSFDKALETTTIPLFARYVLGSLPWALVLVASLALLFQWMAVCALEWLAVVGASRARYLACAACLILASAALVAWLSELTLLRESVKALKERVGLGQLALLVGGHGFLTLSSSGLFLLATVVAWAFPWAARFWPQRSEAAATSSEPLVPPRPGRWQLDWRRGVIAGLVFCLVLLFVRLVLVSSVDEATRRTQLFVAVFFAGQVGFAAVLQAAAAALAAARAPRLGVLQGLFTASVSGALMTAGVLGLNLLFGGNADPAFAWLTLKFVLNLGAVLSLVAALGVCAVRGAGRAGSGP